MASALTLPIAGPVPREYAEQYDDGPQSTYARHIVATGPYRFAGGGPAGEVPGPKARQILMVRNPSWESGTDFRPAFADRIETVPMENRQVAAESVLTGENVVSGDFEAPADPLREALRQRPDQVAPVTAGTIRYASLNTRVEPLDDVDVRRALTAALDRTAAREALGGRRSAPSRPTGSRPAYRDSMRPAGSRVPAMTFSRSPGATSRSRAPTCARPATPPGGTRGLIRSCSRSAPWAPIRPG